MRSEMRLRRNGAVRSEMRLQRDGAVRSEMLQRRRNGSKSLQAGAELRLRGDAARR